MTANPLVRLYHAPVESLTDAAYAVLLLAALVGLWWAAGRNAIYLADRWQAGWRYLVPKWYALRAILLLAAIAVTLLLVAAIVAVLA